MQLGLVLVSELRRFSGDFDETDFTGLALYPKCKFILFFVDNLDDCCNVSILSCGVSIDRRLLAFVTVTVTKEK